MRLHAGPAVCAHQRSGFATRAVVRPSTVAPARAPVARRAPRRIAATPPGGAAPAAPAPAAGANKAAGAAPHWQLALNELENKQPGKVVVVQTAPAVRVAIAETMGLAPGDVTAGQMVTGLKKLGFDYVFDTLFAADMTIMEEGTELLHRLEAKAAESAGKPVPAEDGHAASTILPMFTSCCPGWVAMVEKSNPELIPFLSTCKSPQMMMGAILKNYFAASAGVQPEGVVSCSVMPCVRKQGEADRDWFATEAGPGAVRDVDHVITTAELGKIFQERGINLKELPETEYDNPIGAGSGGAVLFGTTGGVMEAALRTVYELVSGEPMGRITYEEVRGLEGIKAATVTIPTSEGSPFKALESAPGAGVTLRVAVANGLGNAKKVIKGVSDGTMQYDFIEVMACPGGCIGGGGQPRSTDKLILSKRQAAMYQLDERTTIRRSHENPAVQELYKNWLEKPNSHLAHEKLHTHYVPGGVGGDDK
ncbi:iron hydrogenase [Raphidocelis subcapitata]|uniref:Iron hydrogenase n=1 Tax=Raphidocelis subcapitata TaxID=307507 RepID=A0A2V0P2R4_9CHLO|nr:iron hydrogenase [Raphidocelis subcapitata]|eukprot:GBF94161.1 iron hydrogenase [Raphidocelis subcapitata]